MIGWFIIGEKAQRVLDHIRDKEGLTDYEGTILTLGWLYRNVHGDLDLDELLFEEVEQ